MHCRLRWHCWHVAQSHEPCNGNVINYIFIYKVRENYRQRVQAEVLTWFTIFAQLQNTKGKANDVL